MKALVKKMMICVYRLLNVILPKSRRIVVFSSSNGKSAGGNPRAIYEYAAEAEKNSAKGYIFVWFLTDELMRRHPEEAGKLMAVIGGREENGAQRTIESGEVSKSERSIGIGGVAQNGNSSKCRIVRYGHPLYYWYMARAGKWVFDSRQEPYIKKRPGVVYLQTWHGTPLKKLGLDIDEMKMAGESGSIEKYRDAFRQEAAQWDYLIAQNRFSADTFRRCFDFRGKMLEIGYPRNDVLVRAAGETADVAESTAGKNIDVIGSTARQTADVAESTAGHNKDVTVSTAGKNMYTAESPTGRKPDINGKVRTLLYAPTWRDDKYISGGWYAYSSPLDFEKLYDQLGNEFRIIVKPHYLVKMKDTDIPQKLVKNGFVTVCGQSDEINDLYLAADGLITDYSSAMFDYSLLRRPIFFYAYDMEEYADVLRGFYFDFKAEAPGPICKTTGELIEAIREVYAGEVTDRAKNSSGSRTERFRRKYNTYDDGNAARKAWEAIKS